MTPADFEHYQEQVRLLCGLVIQSMEQDCANLLQPHHRKQLADLAKHTQQLRVEWQGKSTDIVSVEEPCDYCGA